MALILSGGDGGNATITGNSGNLTISNAANIFTGSAVVSTTGNVTGGNLFTAGIMSSTGNITGSNILTAGLISSTGNISAGNISVAGALSTAAKGISTSSLPAGTILQVVFGSYSTQTTVTATTFADSGLSASITPTNATSKILVMCSLNLSQATNQGGGIRLLRGATTVFDPNPTDGTGPYGIYGGSSANYGYYPLNYLDSPATTSSTTYKIQMRAYTTGYTASLAINGAPAVPTPGTSTITLMEVAV